MHLDGESVVYDEASGDLHHLNPTATAVLDLCDGSATIAELSAMVAETFGMEARQVEPDIRLLVRQFRRAHLLDAPSRTRSKVRA